ncbi:uncharacterized protein [Nicotiana tomentosiformis]|uniref:uncharacterized protein n=1 Tax=Nicotiana tomentosiformis TaxID=4098 RepID=UPI00388C3E4F
MAPAELKELKEQLKDLLEKGKANVVADALSRRSMGSLEHVEAEKRKLTREIHQLAYLGVQLVDSGNGGVVLQNTAKTSLIAEVKERQYKDPELVKLRERVLQQKKMLLELKGDGVLRYRGRLCVPDVAVLGIGLCQRHIIRGTPFILGRRRCIMTLRMCTGGMI